MRRQVRHHGRAHRAPGGRARRGADQQGAFIGQGDGEVRQVQGDVPDLRGDEGPRVHGSEADEKGAEGEEEEREARGCRGGIR